MTREEAIHKWVLPALKNTWNEKRCEEILKALEQEPCEKAINQQAVLDLFAKFADKDRAYSIVWQNVKSLSPVTPQPKMGKWTNGDNICPCCGEDKFKDLDADVWADWQPKYCPNCGAKMESGNNND